jgi:hypothetical protein
VKRPTCQGTRKDGAPCGSQVLADGTHCYMHAPGIDQQRTEARQRGGHSKANHVRLAKLMPASLAPVLHQLLEALDETRRGEMDPRIAGGLAALAGAIVKVYGAATVEQQIQDLQDQVDRLARRPA